MTPTATHDADRFCREILPRVSRTFALSIRFLPGNLGRTVGVAYLICRIADTVEDDGVASVEFKTAALDALLRAFEGPAEVAAFQDAASWVAGDAHHVELVRRSDLVFAVFRSLPDHSRDRVRHWVSEMVRGMKKFVVLYPRGIRIQTLEEYREYCYYVAGTVGNLLTDLWHEYAPSIGAAKYRELGTRSVAFGEALQTVNILKDIAWDAEHENSIYIPAQSLKEHGSSHQTLLSPMHETSNHAAIRGFIDLAWHDLDEALEYTLAIPRRAFAIRAFCILPLLFAYASLRDLSRSRLMLRPGGTVKISRAEVRALMLVGPLLILSNAGLRWLVSKVRARPVTLWRRHPALTTP
jgi:farnesyl-diphosphate farnesyltransferase